MAIDSGARTADYNSSTWPERRKGEGKEIPRLDSWLVVKPRGLTEGA